MLFRSAGGEAVADACAELFDDGRRDDVIGADPAYGAPWVCACVCVCACSTVIAHNTPSNHRHILTNFAAIKYCLPNSHEMPVDYT